VVKISIPPLGQIPIGDASNGVCGGMVYAALDLFLAQPRLLPPTTTESPTGGSPLMDYLLTRLVDGFALTMGAQSNVNRHLDFMSTLDHDTWLSRGIPSIIVRSEWPKIKADIDAGRPSPIGLVAGNWVWPIDIAAKIDMLGHCHCVLVYGYDLDDAANLTLFVYDPNDPCADDSTIAMNLGNPTQPTPISTPRISARIAGNASFRAFFRYEFYAPVAPPDGVSPGPVPPVLPTQPVAQGDCAQPGEVLAVEQALTSANGQFRLVFQNNASLVLERSDGAQLWTSQAESRSVGGCIMQSDGNLVIYDAAAVPIWASGTWQSPGSRLVVQDDGNVVIVSPDGAPVWATNTVQPALPAGPTAQADTAQPGEILAVNQALTSATGQFWLVYQEDANLVLYRTDGVPLWASATAGHSVGACIMQGDGNLVIYDAAAVPIWASGTWQSPGSRLVVQDDGNVVICNPDGVVWRTNTVHC
jgi:hypothetical protein